MIQDSVVALTEDDSGSLLVAVAGDDLLEHLVGDVLDLVCVDLLAEPPQDVLRHVKVLCGVSSWFPKSSC